MTPLLNRKLLTTEKVTKSEDIDKGTEKLEYMKDAVVTIHRKRSYKFESKSKGSTGWFNIDRELKKKMFYT